MPIPYHVRQAMLRGDYEALRQMGRRGAKNRVKNKTLETTAPTPQKRQPVRDGKAAACGNDD